MKVLAEIIPMEIRPMLMSLVITTIDIETALKITSLVISLAFLIWKWRIDYIENKFKKNKRNE